MPIFFLPSFNVTSFSSFQLFCFYSILFGNCPQLDIPKISSKFSKKIPPLKRNSYKFSRTFRCFGYAVRSIERIEEKRAIREGRDVRHRSKRNEQTFFSFFPPRGRDCLPDCLHNLQHALWPGYSAQSGKFAELRVRRAWLSKMTISSRRFLRPVCLGWTNESWIVSRKWILSRSMTIMMNVSAKWK